LVTTKNYGFELLEFMRINEKDINDFHPIAGSFAVVECKEKFLLCYNTWRQQWELPAGQRETVETPKECAKRELYEETGQVVEDLEFIGLMKVSNTANGNIKFNPVFFSVVDQLQPFHKNEETSDNRSKSLSLIK
jgi:8-oxo-dGTP diphosphatase